MTDKLGDIEKKTLDHGHGKYITTQEFKNLTAYNFTVRFAQAKLAAKDDIADFVKETDFDNKLKSINKKVTSNKIKHVLVVNELDDLLEKGEQISIKGLTKDLINWYSIPTGANIFFRCIKKLLSIYISSNLFMEI